jgi:hypothetical protein
MTAHKTVVLNSTTPTLISPQAVHSGVDITVQNVNAEGYIYLGSENLTTSNYGFRIDPSHAVSFELNGRDILYALASTNGLSVAVITVSLEQGL